MLMTPLTIKLTITFIQSNMYSMYKLVNNIYNILYTLSKPGDTYTIL